MIPDSSKIKLVPIADLKPWDKNPRINDEAAKKLAEMFKRVGFRGTIVCTADNIIRAGHTRVKAAQLAGIKEVPVCYETFESEEQAQAYSLADNKAGEWAEWDLPKLDLVISDLELKGLDLEFTGFDAAEIMKISDAAKDCESVKGAAVSSSGDAAVVLSFVVTPEQRDSITDKLEAIADQNGFKENKCVQSLIYILDAQ